MPHRASTPLADTVSAAEAARLLGVKPATLYTYVSRGWLSSLAGPDGRRRRYPRAEVEAIRRSSEAGKGHRAVAAGAVEWGQPVVDTVVSDIGSRGPRYRGMWAEELVGAGFEATCERLWGVSSVAPPPPGPVRAAPGTPGDAPAMRLLAWITREALDDADRQASAGDVARARRLLLGAAAALAPDDFAASTAAATAAARAGSHGPPTVASALVHALGAAAPAPGLVDAAPGLVDAVDEALVWCADHELNASTFAARVAASTGADLYAALAAGFAALSGPLHGGLSARVEALLDELGPPARVPRALRARLARGESVPGLGHRLYPEGDPRAAALLALARRAPDAPYVLGVVEATVAGLAALSMPPPNLDFGLVAVRRAWGLPRGAAEAIFAVGRMAGWVAHVLEQREAGGLIRPRARYVGPRQPAGAYRAS